MDAISNSNSADRDNPGTRTRCSKPDKVQHFEVEYMWLRCND